MHTRKTAYLQRLARGTDLHAQIARLQLRQKPLSQPILDACTKVDKRKDTSDFTMAILIRLAHLHGNDPLLPTSVQARIENSIRNFRYWLDEPGQDNMIMWSENHLLLFASSEYLGGHLYPNKIFPNAGLSGLAHARKARVRVLRWLDERWRFGFGEWYSPVYLAYSMGPLLNLVDFAPDAEIRNRASMVLDLAIFDLARLTHRGSFGVTAGRAYASKKFSAKKQNIRGLIDILFATPQTPAGGYVANFFANGSTYKVPHVLLGIGKDTPQRLVDRSRHGLSFEEAPKHGIGFQKTEDVLFWWGSGALFSRPIIPATQRLMNRWNLWGMSYFKQMSWMQHIPSSGANIVQGISSVLGGFADGSLTTGGHTQVFRTPDTMLSSVQDYRKGRLAWQLHPWQATLGDEAVVFTTMPASFRGIIGAPGGLNAGLDAWTGSLSLPRIIQVDDVAVILYDRPGELERFVLSGQQTHAYFPRQAFDESSRQGNWVFGRKGDGYVALYSARPTHWQTNGPDAGKELIAPGYRNVWICQMGRKAEDGSFAQFRRTILAAKVTPSGLRDDRFPGSLPKVRYQAPGLGLLEVPWSGPSKLNETLIPVGQHPRFDNPYSQVPMGSTRLRIDHGGAHLEHNWNSPRRSGTGL
jgi:hypothetical protein